MNNVFPLLLTLLFCSACGDSSNTSQGKAPKDLASEFCNCAKASIDLNHQMANLLEQGEKDAFIQLSSKAGKTFKETIQCIEQKVGQQDAELDKTQIETHLRQNCQGIPDRLIQDIFLKVSK